MSDATTDSVPTHRYTAAMAGDIERRWQDHWSEHGTFHAPNPVGPLSADGADGADGDVRAEVSAGKLFVQDMFPYPSGAGLHVGHPLGFIGTDVFARYHRMTGHNVLHTMGFDAFGLPAEQYAVQTGQHPRAITEDNINTYLRQIRRLGLGHDERRRISTIDPGYYRWTQWIFLQIFNSWFDDRIGRARPIAELEAEFAQGTKVTGSGTPWADLSDAERRVELNAHRLVYLSDAPVNWVPGLGTVISNEEVTADGRSERGNFPVFRKNLRQWMMRITAYSDRLIDDLDRLEWPEKVKSMQRNWIGRSHGARVKFACGAQDAIEVFTTRPDTLFGATFMVLAPEHPLVEKITTAAQADAVATYRHAATMKSELDRQENKDKTGVFTGAHATNPVTGTQIPVFVADYVLMGYGTGAIMAVPGQDARDWDFATAYELPIIRTVQPSEGHDDATPFLGDGPAINSGFLDGLGVDEAKKTIIAWLEDNGHGHGTVQYKLRDWLFSRQRYWGEPFPIVYDEDGSPVAVPESMLPVELPEVADYAPRTYDPQDHDTEPAPPLAKASDWVEVELDLGDGRRTYRRDTNTMPNWAGSCWYQLRYVDPTDDERFCEPANERYWLGPQPATHGAHDPGGVDLYVGGVEHAVLHLLYARFWQKVLFDLGHVSGDEPYRKLFNQGYIQAYAYTDERGSYVPAEEVREQDGGWFWQDKPVSREYGKMGKSLKNVVTPDEMCANYGADTFRLYEMSMGPLDVSRPWATKDVIGAQRFLQRLWRAVVDEETGEVRVSDAELDPGNDIEALRMLNRTVAGVREDYAAMRYNTAGAKLIELNNYLTKRYATEPTPRALAEPLVLMLAPMCPHIAEELWRRLGHEGSLAHGPFPAADERYLVEDTVEYPIQVNGKVRSRMVVPSSAGQDEVRAAALAEEKVAALVAGGEPRKVIVVPGRLVNIVL